MEKTYAMECSEGHIHPIKENLNQHVENGVITKFKAKHFDFNTVVTLVNMGPSSNKCHMEREKTEDAVIEFASVASLINQDGWKTLSPVVSLFRSVTDDGEDHLPKVLLSLGEIQVLAYIGTGSTNVFIKKSVYEKVKENNPRLAKFEKNTPGFGKRCTINGSCSKPKIEKISCVDFCFGDLQSPRQIYRMPVFIMEDLGVDILLGNSFLHDLPKYRMVLGPDGSNLQFSNPVSEQRYTVPIRYKCSIEDAAVIELDSVAYIYNCDWKTLKPNASLIRIHGEEDTLPKVLLSFGEIRTLAYVGTGTTHVFIDESFYERVKEKNSQLAKFEKSTPGFGNQCTTFIVSVKLKIDKISCVEFSFADLKAPRKTYRMPVFIVKNAGADLLLGLSWLGDFGNAFPFGNYMELRDPESKQLFTVPIRTKCSIED